MLNYGFKNSAIKFLNNYFSGRLQSVKIGDTKSSPLNINLGVPQGSVLGPLLFLIYINDLPYFLNHISCKLFADDTTLSFSASSLTDCISHLNVGLSKLLDWCKYNFLYINWSKTYAMIITNKRCTRPVSLTFHNYKIEVVPKFKLLGVWIDAKLSFIDHVYETVNSVYKRLYCIKKLFYLSFNVKIQFFKTFILPIFDYFLSIIIYFSKAAITKLIKTYYFILFKLFKFKFVNCDVDFINSSLSSYNIFAFE